MESIRKKIDLISFGIVLFLLAAEEESICSQRQTDERQMVSMSTDANADDNEAEVWKTPLFVLYAKLRV